MNELLKTTKNLTILYIEDEDGIRESTTKTLKLLCHNVISLPNCNNAMEVYNKIKPNIIISDVMLDDINGIEFVKSIREINKTIPVILLSASTNKEFLFDAIKLKLIDYLVKPIDYNDLIRVLEKSTEQLEQNGELEIYINDKIFYNLSLKTLSIDNNKVSLTLNELNFLELLIKNRTRMVSPNEIKNHVWGGEEMSEGALKSLIHKLRKKIGKENITSLSGVGYKIVIQDTSRCLKDII